MLTVDDIISKLKVLEWSATGVDLSTLQARKAAYLVNRKYNKYSVPPIYAEKIIQEEGLSLRYEPLSEPFVAAFNRKEKMIVLADNKELLNKWGNFALAHALGHWYLHDTPIDYFSSETFKKPQSQKDIEANYFASFLLLPEKLLQEWQWLPKHLFSSAFNVPGEVTTFRLNHL